MNDDLIAKLTQLFKAFRQKDATVDGTLDVYLERLSEFPAPVVIAAIDRLIDTSRFLPTIAEIKESAVLGPLGQQLADEAWVEVRREARRVGYNRPPVFSGGRFLPADVPEFSSPVIAAAAYAVGWELICTGDDSRGFIRDQFLKAFKALSERETRAKQAGVVPLGAEALPRNGVAAIGERS